MAMAMPSLIREVPGARLFLAGRGKKGPRLRDLCRELGLCNREDMHRAFQGVDAFIFASLASEGFPLVLLEAMALNVSVMASRTCEGYGPEGSRSPKPAANGPTANSMREEALVVWRNATGWWRITGLRPRSASSRRLTARRVVGFD